ncbi:MAG: MFS transporter [Clostridiales bacterium]|nr:MFS transporter [Clostridiales bacterium]
MATLLIVIYLSFISLGLPDSMLGAAWPAIALEMGLEAADLGLVSMIVTLGTVISSLLSVRLIKGLGTGRVMILSVLLTAVVLLLFSFAKSYLVLCLLALPLGLGGGSVDAALNGFVARNYKASHMNWLHCMWGVGATISPLIMGKSLAGSAGWPGGYKTVALLQGSLFVILLLSLPLWRRAEKTDPLSSNQGEHIGNGRALRTPGLITAMAAFACFVGFEAIAGVWAASFLEGRKGFDPAAAASLASLYYLGTTLGRAVSGLIAIKVDSKRLIRWGCLLATLGALLLALPLPPAFSLAAYVLLGIGNAPIYPAMIHLTPLRFGVAVSQAAMGLQMAAAYTGSTLLPPLTGVLVRFTSLDVVPYIVLALILLGYFLSQLIDKQTKVTQAGASGL